MGAVPGAQSLASSLPTHRPLHQAGTSSHPWEMARRGVRPPRKAPVWAWAVEPLAWGPEPFSPPAAPGPWRRMRFPTEELSPSAHRPQPSITNSNSQQLMYLFTLPAGEREDAGRRQLGRGRGPRAGSHLSRSVGFTPGREVVAPLSHLAGRAVYWNSRPGEAVSSSTEPSTALPAPVCFPPRPPPGDSEGT